MTGSWTSREEESLSSEAEDEEEDNDVDEIEVEVVIHNAAPAIVTILAIIHIIHNREAPSHSAPTTHWTPTSPTPLANVTSRCCMRCFHRPSRVCRTCCVKWPTSQRHHHPRHRQCPHRPRCLPCTEPHNTPKTE